MLMKPGATAIPVASTVVLPFARLKVADRGDGVAVDGKVDPGAGLSGSVVDGAALMTTS
jgi:hypothetical protein